MNSFRAQNFTNPPYMSLTETPHSSIGIRNLPYQYLFKDQDYHQLTPVGETGEDEIKTARVFFTETSQTIGSTNGKLNVRIDTPKELGHYYLDYEITFVSPSVFIPTQNWEFQIDSPDIIKPVGNFIIERVHMATDNIYIRAFTRATVVQAVKSFDTTIKLYCTTSNAKKNWFGLVRCSFILASAYLTPAIGFKLHSDTKPRLDDYSNANSTSSSCEILAIDWNADNIEAIEG